MGQQFIVKNQAKADELVALLRQNLYLDDPRQFIQIFNSGMVVKGNPEVKQLLSLLEDAYKDVAFSSTRRGLITLVSEEEVLLSEALETLRQWEIASKVRREVQEAVDAGIVRLDRPLLLEKVVGSGFMLSTLHQQQNEEDGQIEIVPEVLPRASSIVSEEAEFLARAFAQEDVPQALQDAISDRGVLLSVEKILSVENSFVPAIVSQIPKFIS